MTDIDRDDLEKAAEEWAPEENTAPKSEKRSGRVAQPSNDGPVAFIQDPLQAPDFSEIADAQESDEELILNDDPEETARTLDGLKQAMDAETERQLGELEELTAETAVEASARLAQEIAEDEALAREMLAEAASEDFDEAGSSGQLADQPLSLEEMQSSVEALLFMSDKPVSLNRFKDMLGERFDSEMFNAAIGALTERYQAATHGIQLTQVAGGYQLRTKPDRAWLSRKMAKVQTQRLSSGAMETLAIIAYKQPVLKEDIDKVRGVDSSHFVRILLDKKLIEMTGRSELPGRPIVYGTTKEFLEIFGLNDLNDMPPLRELEQMVPTSKTGEDDPRVREMRRLVGEMKASNESLLHYDPKEDEKILQDIRERVNSIPTSSPTVEAQKEAAKAPAPGFTLEPSV